MSHLLLTRAVLWQEHTGVIPFEMGQMTKTFPGD